MKQEIRKATSSELESERRAAMSSSQDRHGPRQLGDILTDLFAARGYARLRARDELESAWSRAVGESRSKLTKLGGIRRGVLTVVVAHSALLEEFAAFEKQAILASLRGEAVGSVIRDIKFRVGSVDDR